MKIRKNFSYFLLVVLSLLLANCGGSGGSGTQPVQEHVHSDALSLSGAVTTLAGTVGTAGSKDGSRSAANFNNPVGICTDGINLFVTDFFSNTIRKIVITSGAVTTLAGSAGTTGAADGIGAAASFNGPGSITTDGTNLYVTDYYNSTIRKVVITTGAVTTLAGSVGTTGSTDGIGLAASFKGPSGITTDGTNLYVVDTLNSNIRKISISTGLVTTIAGTAGSRGISDGIGTSARFNNPAQITTDDVSLYVTDFASATIRRVVIATGAVTTIAGTALTTGSADGVGTAARFNSPNGITTDGTNLYIVDSSPNTIRKLVISTGEVTTLAGLAGTTGAADGIGSSALFWYPVGIATDNVNLYVTDTNNNTIRMIQ